MFLAFKIFCVHVRGLPSPAPMTSTPPAEPSDWLFRVPLASHWLSSLAQHPCSRTGFCLPAESAAMNPLFGPNLFLLQQEQQGLTGPLGDPLGGDHLA